MDFSWLFISKTQLLKFAKFQTIQINVGFGSIQNIAMCYKRALEKQSILVEQKMGGAARLGCLPKHRLGRREQASVLSQIVGNNQKTVPFTDITIYTNAFHWRAPRVSDGENSQFWCAAAATPSSCLPGPTGPYWGAVPACAVSAPTGRH